MIEMWVRIQGGVFVHWPGSNPTAPNIALAAEAAARVRERKVG